MQMDPIYEAIALLSTRAGMLMEDAAAEAVSAPPLDPEQLERWISDLRLATADALALLRAADAIRRRRDIA
jgi:hypothetical protein